MNGNESKLTGIIDTSLSNIKEIIDVNTVVGEPVQTTGGTVIIPVSKVSLAYVSGGVDYLGKNTPVEKGKGFGGGGGTGVTLNPVGFLVIKASGNVEYLPVVPGDKIVPAPDKIDTVISLIERAPEIIEKIKSFIAANKPASEDPETEEKPE
mgnify:CR=1 FL=1